MPKVKSNRATSASSMQVSGRAAWRAILLLVWAAWWGGLSFHALIVVPIGTDLLVSTEQGFVTQRVTQWHNGLSALLLLCLFVEALRGRKRSVWFATVALTTILIALVVWHSRLTALMDFHQLAVPSSFYSPHATYLWITACEWLLGLAMPIWILPVREPSGLTKIAFSERQTRFEDG